MAKQEKNPEIIELARSLRGTPWCEEYENMISGMLYAYLAHTIKCMKSPILIIIY